MATNANATIRWKELKLHAWTIHEIADDIDRDDEASMNRRMEAKRIIRAQLYAIEEIMAAFGGAGGGQDADPEWRRKV